MNVDSTFLIVIGFLSMVFGCTYVWYFRHRAWIYFWTKFYSTSRQFRAHATAISTIGTLGVVLGAYYLQEPDAIVLVTLFYATALFFTNFLQSERPFPVIAFENDYYGDGYGEKGEEGFQYEFALQNNGTTNLIDPTVEYRLYNSDFEPVRKNYRDNWIEHSDTDREDVTLAPGEHERFEIEYSPIVHNGETDYFLCVKISPRFQYSEVTLLYCREIVAED